MTIISYYDEEYSTNTTTSTTVEELIKQAEEWLLAQRTNRYPTFAGTTQLITRLLAAIKEAREENNRYAEWVDDAINGNTVLNKLRDENEALKAECESLKGSLEEWKADFTSLEQEYDKVKAEREELKKVKEDWLKQMEYKQAIRSDAEKMAEAFIGQHKVQLQSVGLFTDICQCEVCQIARKYVKGEVG